ncbi:MAG: ChaN family lipoprotein [Desulfuromonas sp.]|nr:ChaN family lipoprotein [Desulfuromonas sp.]
MRPILFATKIFAAVLLLSLVSCTPPQPLGHANNPYPLPEPIALDTLVHLATGTPLSMTQMLTAINHDRLIYIGETHDNPASHRLQLEIISALRTQHGNQLAVGMEMFHPNQQPVLDHWVAGELTEKAFIRELNWYRNWRIDYAYYRDLLNLMREQHIAIVALNVTPEQKQQTMQQTMQATDMPQAAVDPYYRATLRSYFAGHDAGKRRIDSFIRIQSLWDDTMAQSIINYLCHPDHADHQLVILAGANHIRYGFGIPRRVFQQLPLPYSLIGNDEIEIDESKRDTLMDVTLPEIPLLPYHYLLYNRYEAGPERMQLGVRLEQQGKQVMIVSIIADSLAERYQLQAGDIVQQIDGELVTEVFDVIYAIGQQRAGDELALVVKRGDKELSMTVVFE